MFNNFNEKNFNITKNINIIEFLKSRLLLEIAFLHENMVKIKQDNNDKKDIISEIILISYILSNKLGINYDDLDKKIIAKLKIAMLEKDDNYSCNISSLLKHIDNRITK